MEVVGVRSVVPTCRIHDVASMRAAICEAAEIDHRSEPETIERFTNWRSSQISDWAAITESMPQSLVIGDVFQSMIDTEVMQNCR